jgi:hypothetical protein
MKWIDQLDDYKVRQRFRYFYLIVLLLLWIATIGANVRVKENEEYTDFNHVAVYILKYNDVPSNYVPKAQGAPTGSYEVSVYDVYDNTRDPVKLPTGYTYTEVYINATIDNVGSERFVFSDNGLYYTINHYDSFSEITSTKILGGYYMFQSILITFLIGGVGFVGLMIVVSKQITAQDLKDDLILDYNLCRGKIQLINDKIKFQIQKKKYIRQQNKKEE